MLLKGAPELDVNRLKFVSYDNLLQDLIDFLQACTIWMQNVDVSLYKRLVLTQFIHENRKKVAELTAIIDINSDNYKGYTVLHLNDTDAFLDRRLFEFEMACIVLLQRLDFEKPIKTKSERVKRLVTLLFFCVMSFVISTSTTYSIKAMQNNHLAGRKFPILVASMQSCSVFLNFFIWIGAMLIKRSRDVQRSSARPFWFRLRAYLILGVVDAAHIILQSFSLTQLQGSLYTVLKSAGIIFSVILSKVIVRKVFLFEHWLAVGMMCISIIGCAAFQQATSSDFYQFLLGMALTLSSCFLVALLGVLQQKLMVDFKHTDETVDVITEANFFQSVVAFLAVVIYAPFVKESRDWVPMFTRFHSEGNSAFFVLVVTVIAARSLSVFSAMGVTTYASAMFSRSYSAIRQSLQVILLSFLLNEKFESSKIFALVMSSASFCMYVYAGYLLQQRKMGKAIVGLRGHACEFIRRLRYCVSPHSHTLPK